MIAKVSGIELFYTVGGQGRPIILLHGNGEDHSIFNRLASELYSTCTVYQIDSRDHGQSSKVTSLDYHIMADDIAAFISQKQIVKPVILGFSDGGIIGLLLAMQYPELLDKLIVCGANLNPDGIKTFNIILMKLNFFFSRNSKLRLMLTQPNIAIQSLGRIAIPTLVIAGERDLVKVKHTRTIAASIRESTLKILPGENHSSYIANSSKICPMIVQFIQPQ